MEPFSKRVLDAVRRVPCGKVATYGQIARLVGAPRSARYVGFALRTNEGPEHPEGAPCHRIVFKDGRICEGYAFGGPEVQRELLEREGVSFLDEMHVDMAACQWDPGTDAESAGASDERADALPTRPADIDWAREMSE